LERKSYDPIRLPRCVRTLRNAAGLTQAELAERANLAFETISRIESGREPPSLWPAVSLADALSAPLDGIVGRTASPHLEDAKAATGSAAARRLLSYAARIDDKTLGHLVSIARSLATAEPRAKGRRHR